jgi:hypothetical protein
LWEKRNLINKAPTICFVPITMELVKASFMGGQELGVLILLIRGLKGLDEITLGHLSLTPPSPL